MSDLIDRPSAIATLVMAKETGSLLCGELRGVIDVLNKMPSAQPDKEKISDALYRIYLNTSPHTSAEGVAAIKYYIAEIWREIYGEEGPGWMR